MNKNLKLAVLTLSAFFMLTGCGKNDNNTTPPAKTKTELLTLSAWKYKSATVGGADASSYLQACQKDNVLTFLANGTGSGDEGPTKCNAGDPQTNSFTWNFASGETILHTSNQVFSNTSNDFTIISLTATELVVETTYTPIAGPSLLVRVTFQH